MLYSVRYCIVLYSINHVIMQRMIMLSYFYLQMHIAHIHTMAIISRRIMRKCWLCFVHTAAEKVILAHFPVGKREIEMWVLWVYTSVFAPFCWMLLLLFLCEGVENEFAHTFNMKEVLTLEHALLPRRQLKKKYINTFLLWYVLDDVLNEFQSKRTQVQKICNKTIQNSNSIAILRRLSAIP